MRERFAFIGILVLLGSMAILSGGCFKGASGSGTAVSPAGSAPQAGTPAPVGTARVSFAIRLDEEDRAAYEPRMSVRGNGTAARVRFRLTGLNIHGTGNEPPTTTTETTVEVPAGARVATISIDAPPGPAVAQIAVLGNGSIENARDFAGATTLNPGANVMTVNPTNSRMEADRLANTVRQLAVATETVRAGSRINIIGTARSAINNVDRNAEAADQKGVVGALSTIRPANMVELNTAAAQHQGQPIPATALTAGPTDRIDASLFWGANDLSEPTVQHMAFKHILRHAIDGVGFVACEHRFFPDCFAVARVGANGARQAFVRNRGRCYSTFPMPDTSIVVGGNCRAQLKPVLFRWNGSGNAHTKGARNDDADDSGPDAGMQWVRYFNEVSLNDPDAGVTAVRLDGDNDGVLLVSVKEADGSTKVYRINSQTGQDATEGDVTAPVQGRIVPRGTIVGQVAEMLNDGSTRVLSGVTVEVLDANGTPVASKLNETDGGYTFSLVAGTYSVRFSKSGFDGSTYGSVVVAANQTTRLNTVQLQDTSVTRLPADINGTVRYYSTQQEAIIPVPYANVSIYQGLEAAGSPFRTGQADQNGAYSFVDIPPGMYTIKASAQGGYDAFLNVYAKPNMIHNGRDIFMSAIGSGAELRMVLTWNQVPDAVRRTQAGENPPSELLDLDAHLIGPMLPDLLNLYPEAPYRFDMHWRYAHTTGSANDNSLTSFNMPLSDLNQYVEQDVDKMNGYGPEIITLKLLCDTEVYGNYMFYVRDYYRSPDFSAYRTDGGLRSQNPDDVLGRSEARVRVYQGSGLRYTFTVPNGERGCDWNVFRIRTIPGTVANAWVPIIEPIGTMDTFDDLNYTSETPAFAASRRANLGGMEPNVKAIIDASKAAAEENGTIWVDLPKTAN